MFMKENWGRGSFYRMSQTSVFTSVYKFLTLAVYEETWYIPRSARVPNLSWMTCIANLINEENLQVTACFIFCVQRKKTLRLPKCNSIPWFK